MSETRNCTRCGNLRKTVFIFKAVPGGYSWPTLAQPDFEVTVPTVESVCGDCLTDDEILRELTPVVEFALGALIRGGASPSVTVSLETARAYFMVRNNNPDGNSRRAAVKALGLESESQPPTERKAGRK